MPCWIWLISATEELYITGPRLWNSFVWTPQISFHFITARSTLVQSAVLRSHVVCLSVRPSVRLSVCLSVCDVGEL